MVAIHDIIKLLNNEDSLELFKEAVELMQQEEVQNSTVEQIVAVSVPRLRPRSFTTRMRRNRSGWHDTKARV